MNSEYDQTIPLWWKNEHRSERAFPLEESVTADVCVVGAGIAGLTTGYLLAREGKSVAILEARGIAAGESGRTTAHLTATLDDRFFTLKNSSGKPRAGLPPTVTGRQSTVLRPSRGKRASTAISSGSQAIWWRWMRPSEKNFPRRLQR